MFDPPSELGMRVVPLSPGRLLTPTARLVSRRSTSLVSRLPAMELFWQPRTHYDAVIAPHMLLRRMAYLQPWALEVGLRQADREVAARLLRDIEEYCIH